MIYYFIIYYLIYYFLLYYLFFGFSFSSAQLPFIHSQILKNYYLENDTEKKKQMDKEIISFEMLEDLMDKKDEKKGTREIMMVAKSRCKKKKYKQ